MSGLSFLKNVTLAANAAVAPTSRTSAAVAKNPEKAHLRIYKNGAVYPSAKLVTACSLQYQAKDAEKKGNGFDVFSSKDFMNTAHLKESFMFIAMVPKDAKFGKVDLFSTTKFNEDGSPKADVLTQGSINLELLEQIKSIYNVDIAEGENFIDLVIVQSNPFTTPDNIYYIPKKGVRGDNKGKSEVVRRENLTLYALVPASLMDEENADTEEVVDKKEETVQEPKAEVNETATEEKSEFEPTESKEDEVMFEDTEGPEPAEESTDEPSLKDFEAEDDGEASPAAPLPDGVLEEDAIDPDSDEFSLEED